MMLVVLLLSCCLCLYTRHQVQLFSYPLCFVIYYASAMSANMVAAHQFLNQSSISDLLTCNAHRDSV